MFLKLLFAGHHSTAILYSAFTAPLRCAIALTKHPGSLSLGLHQWPALGWLQTMEVSSCKRNAVLDCTYIKLRSCFVHYLGNNYIQVPVRKPGIFLKLHKNLEVQAQRENIGLQMMFLNEDYTTCLQTAVEPGNVFSEVHRITLAALRRASLDSQCNIVVCQQQEVVVNRNEKI